MNHTTTRPSQSMPPRHGVESTAALLIARLPATPTVSPDEIAAALGLRTTNSILRAIACGQLTALRVGGRYIIAREVAARWIASSSVEPDEA